MVAVRPVDRRGRPDVTIVVPTRNEAVNIDVLLGRVAGAMHGAFGPALVWDVVFVDDSDDDTPAVIEAAVIEAAAVEAAGAEAAPRLGAPVVIHHRPAGRRPGGLGGAVQEGFALAQGRVVAVMDADLQHPPEVLPDLLGPILDGRADLVAGDRYGRDGDRGGLAGPGRRLAASVGRSLVHGVLPGSRVLGDPLSGLFAFERRGLEDVALRPEGFKILLEVVARGHWHSIDNIGYRFDRRHAGRSKASLREGVRFGIHVWRLARGVVDTVALLATTAPSVGR